MAITYLDDEPKSKITYLDEQPIKKESIPEAFGNYVRENTLGGLNALSFGGVDNFQNWLATKGIGHEAEPNLSRMVGGLGGSLIPVGGALNLAGKAIGKTAIGKGISYLTNTKKATDFAEKLRGSFYAVKSRAVSEFGDKLDELARLNPNVKISLNNVVDDIKNGLAEMPNEAKAVFRKTPILRDMLKEKGARGSDVTLKEAQEIINYINTKVPQKIKSSHLDILETLNDVRASQLDAFQEMAGVRESYHSIIKPYNDVKNYFKFNKVLSGIKSDFGGAEGIEAVKKILPESVIKEMGGYKKAGEFLSFLSKAGGTAALGAGGAVAYHGYQSVFGKK